jgi:extracellular elastinolytic metalloproteinase
VSFPGTVEVRARDEREVAMKPLIRAFLGLSLSVGSMALSLPASVGQVPGSDGESNVRAPEDEYFDAREGSVAPSAEQEAMVSSLGAHVTWNRFGTPQSLIKYGGYLATGLSLDPEAAARQWVQDNSALFRLSSQEAAGLELLNLSPMARSKGRAVIFRQRFGDLPAAQDGLITVGITEGKIAYVSSSAAGNQGVPGSATLSPTEAWIHAAANIGRTPDAITNGGQNFDWTTFKVAGFSGLQRVRLRALPMFAGEARPAYEVIVLDLKIPHAYTMFVDAQTGKVWWRQNQVNEFAAGEAAPQLFQFTGTYVAPACGPFHGPYNAPVGTVEIDVYAQGLVPEDIVLNLHHPQGTVVASSDIPVGDNPEVIRYTPGGGVPPGDYWVQVCPFEPTQQPPSTQYGGAVIINDVASVNLPGHPKWKVFPANPPLDLSTGDTRRVYCWEGSVAGQPVPECEREVKNLAARVPWDVDPRTGQPTFTTIGNAANAAESWLSPLTPGEGQGARPVAPDRRYIFDDPWPNTWQVNKCNPAVLAPPGLGNDIRSATVNLFVGLNLMHDWTYFLGFTEQNSNAQQFNFGITPANRENDPDFGGVQAGAVTGGYPTFEGRNNASQVTLPDGVPGITNMYLWQPRPESYLGYGPCVDGSLDLQVFAHEYTHLVSQRMVAGPDAGLSGPQAGAMGESWSDLNAVEFAQEYGVTPTGGENPFAAGVYVSGNLQRGFRDYPMNDSPLNYSDIGFDYHWAEDEVHNNGEIWSATNYDIRQALIAKYNTQYPASDATLQRECADGGALQDFPRPLDNCPGNRRWIQIVHDSFLLMPSTASMLDARDAYLAADVMRFGGANQVELWRAFAKRGMGEFAFTDGNADLNPKPNFESGEETNEATITFTATAFDEGGNPVSTAKIYVGHYQHRITQTADTDPANDAHSPTPGENVLDNVVKFVPGTYEFTVQAPGYGIQRFTRTFSANQVATVNFALPTNWASSAKGATASGDADPTSPVSRLIDDLEGPGWFRQGALPTVAGTHVTVDLSGGVRTVRRVQVSALVAMYASLRQFEIWTCNATTADCAVDANFTKIFTSPPDAFPGGRPSPVTPELIMRSFVVPFTDATHVRLVVLHNQCTGQPAFSGAQNPSNDPNVNPDCVNGGITGTPTTAEQNVGARELEVFGPRKTSRPRSIPG